MSTHFDHAPTMQHDYGFSYVKLIFVLVLFILSLVCFVAQTELTSIVYSQYNFDEPILFLYLTHGTWWLLWPLQFISIAVYKTSRKYFIHINGYDEINSKPWKGFRKAFASSVKAQHRNIFYTAEIIAAENIPNYQFQFADSKVGFKYYHQFFKSVALRNILKSCFLLSIILNIAGSTWYLAMKLSTGSDVTAIYNCSAFTAYIFAIPILKEKFSWLKANSVLIAISGVFIVAYMGKSSSSSNNYPHRLLGNVIILIGAILYGLYEVIYKKLSCPPSNEVSARRQATFSNFSMCLIGISTFIIMGVPMLFIHVTGIHKFHVPSDSKAWLIIWLSILCNQMFSVSFLGLMSLTSPVFSSVASLVTILLVGVFEWIFRGIIITLSQFIGYIIIMLGFGLLTYASWSEISEEDKDDELIDTDTDTESTYSSTGNNLHV